MYRNAQFILDSNETNRNGLRQRIRFDSELVTTMDTLNLSSSENDLQSVVDSKQKIFDQIAKDLPQLSKKNFCY